MDWGSAKTQLLETLLSVRGPAGLAMALGLGLLVSLFIAWRYHKPVVAARRPPLLVALSWPYLPLIFALLLLALGGWAVWATWLSGLVRHYLQSHHRAPAWFILLVTPVVGWFLARNLSRRYFRWAFFGSLALVVLFAVLTPPRHPGTGTSAAPPGPLVQLVPGNGCGTVLVPCAPPPPASTGEKAREKVKERLGANLFDRLLGETNTVADGLTLGVMGGALLFFYTGLSRLNARRELPSVSVGPIEDEGEKRQHHLERLLMECLQRSAPHAPPRFPGGSLIYWKQLAESLSGGNGGWQEKVAGFFMKLFAPAHGLQVQGTLIRGTKGRPARLSIELLEEHSKRALMVRTFQASPPREGQADTYTDEEDAAVNAGYAVAEHTLQLCEWLPEWALWREEEGSALRCYWRGYNRLRELDRASEAQQDALLQQAAADFREAAERSNGNALALLQLGQVLEARFRFVEALEIYLNLAERYPRMFGAAYRLSAVLVVIDSWEADVTQHSERWDALKGTLDRSARVASFRLDCPEREDAPAVRRYFLELAEKLVGQLQGHLRWKALGRMLFSNSDRQRFWKTVFWPPGQQRATDRVLVVARGCLQLRQYQGEQGSQRPSGRTVEQVAKARAALLKDMDGVAQEADNASQKRRGLAWGPWGQVHYNLACFYSLALSGFPRGAQGSGWEAESFANKAIKHLTAALHDPAGPLASGSIWWLYRDKKLEPLRKGWPDLFEEWNRTVLGRKSRASPGEAPAPSPRRTRDAGPGRAGGVLSRLRGLARRLQRATP